MTTTSLDFDATDSTMEKGEKEEEVGETDWVRAEGRREEVPGIEKEKQSVDVIRLFLCIFADTYSYKLS